MEHAFCVYNILIATHLQPEYTTNTHETRGEHSVRRRGPIHRDPYPDITKYTYPFQQIRIFTLSNMRFCSPFRGCLRICKYHKIALTHTLATRYNTTTYTKCLLSHCKITSKIQLIENKEVTLLA